MGTDQMIELVETPFLATIESAGHFGRAVEIKISTNAETGIRCYLSQPEHSGLHTCVSHTCVSLDHRISSSMKCCHEIGLTHFVRLSAKVS